LPATFAALVVTPAVALQLSASALMYVLLSYRVLTGVITSVTSVTIAVAAAAQVLVVAAGRCLTGAIAILLASDSNQTTHTALSYTMTLLSCIS
jgi:hypothetical protein